MSGFYVYVGILHFIDPEWFLFIMPPFLSSIGTESFVILSEKANNPYSFAHTNPTSDFDTAPGLLTPRLLNSPIILHSKSLGFDMSNINNLFFSNEIIFYTW